jgi:HK97 family phage prohead protease
MSDTLTLPPAQERRITGIELRDVETTDSLSMLRGRAVPYGEDADIGFYVESFARGSLGKSARESAARLPLHVFHDNRAMPIGSADKWEERDDGLYGVWRLTPEPEAQRAARHAQNGDLPFMSVSFQPIRSAWEFRDDYNPDLGIKDRVVRTEARLLETSLVSTPAYANATVEWVRSAEKIRPGRRTMVDEWRAELQRLRDIRPGM